MERIIKKGTRIMSKQRVYLIVLDSFGIGNAPDAADLEIKVQIHFIQLHIQGNMIRRI